MNANLNYTYSANPSGGMINWVVTQVILSYAHGCPSMRLPPAMKTISATKLFLGSGILQRSMKLRFTINIQILWFQHLFCLLITHGDVNNNNNNNNTNRTVKVVMFKVCQLSYRLLAFADVLSGLVRLSGSYNDRKETPTSNPTTLPGLSENLKPRSIHSWKLRLYRISSRYRSDFQVKPQRSGPVPQKREHQSETVVDAINRLWLLNESGIESLYGLSVQFQVNNF